MVAQSLYELQLRTIQASPRLFCDETPMPVLDPGRRRTRICQFWAHAVDDRPWGGPAPPAVAYVFAGGKPLFGAAAADLSLDDIDRLQAFDHFASER